MTSQKGCKCHPKSSFTLNCFRLRRRHNEYFGWISCAPAGPPNSGRPRCLATTVQASGPVALRQDTDQTRELHAAVSSFPEGFPSLCRNVLRLRFFSLNGNLTVRSVAFVPSQLDSDPPRWRGRPGPSAASRGRAGFCSARCRCVQVIV